MLKLKNILKEGELETDIEHTIGNALFALETNILPLLKRIQSGKVDEASEIVMDMKHSIEKAKEGLLKWKNRNI